MIEPATKKTDRLPPVPLTLEWPSLGQPLIREVRPTERERQQRHQLPQSLGVGDVRRLQAEAARLQTAEQSLDPQRRA